MDEFKRYWPEAVFFILFGFFFGCLAKSCEQRRTIDKIRENYEIRAENVVKRYWKEPFSNSAICIVELKDSPYRTVILAPCDNLDRLACEVNRAAEYLEQKKELQETNNGGDL